MTVRTVSQQLMEKVAGAAERSRVGRVRVSQCCCRVMSSACDVCQWLHDCSGEPALGGLAVPGQAEDPVNLACGMAPGVEVRVEEVGEVKMGAASGCCSTLGSANRRAAGMKRRAA